MLIESAHDVVWRSLADGSNEPSLSLIVKAARQLTLAKRAAIVLDPMNPHTAVVAAINDAGGRSSSRPIPAGLIMLNAEPQVRMVELITGDIQIGVLVLSGLAGSGQLTQSMAREVLELAGIAAIAVVMSRAQRFIDQGFGWPDECDLVSCLWSISLDLRLRQTQSPDPTSLRLIRDRVDGLITEVQLLSLGRRVSLVRLRSAVASHNQLPA